MTAYSLIEQQWWLIVYLLMTFPKSKEKNPKQIHNLKPVSF